MIEVVRTLGLCTVQDFGRRGHMHEAVPPGGSLVPELLTAANWYLGNRDDAPAIEVLGRLVVRATAPVEIATDRTGPLRLEPGAEHVIESAPLRAAYLAMRGGIDAPLVLGGRGTLLCAGLGKPLARGDVLRAGDAITHTRRDVPPFSLQSTIHVTAGPDLDAFGSDAIEQLQATTFRISPTSDRTGTRLEGPALTRVSTYRERSRPMVIGALEVPRDGQPIVLGPEHPTTGGYPILAVIATERLGRFFAIPLGGSVRFRLSA